MRKYPIYLLLPLILAISCKEDEIPIPDYRPPESDRVVLLEDFTGVRCPNCPEAEREIDNLMDIFPDNLVAISIYTDELGTPFTDSKYDFRTEEGNELQDFLGTLLAKPSAVINRKIWQGTNTRFNLDVPTWAGTVAGELEDFSDLSLEIEHTYDPGSRQLDITVGAIPKLAIVNDLRVSVLITESGIVDPQDDVTGKIDDYVHNHVLRTFLTDFKGDPLAQSPYQAQQTYSAEYSFVLPPEDGWWVADNCHIVAFVSEVDGESIEILQAGEVDVVE